MTARVHEGLVEHAAIDKAFRALLDSFSDPASVPPLFEAVADLIRHHMASEQLDVARFADVDPEEAKALLHEHASIGDELDQLAARAKAATLAAKDVHDFKVRFSLHEAREETGLYRWVMAH
jgi:hypothetical protein